MSRFRFEWALPRIPAPPGFDSRNSSGLRPFKRRRTAIGQKSQYDSIELVWFFQLRRMTGMLKRVCLRARYQARNVNVVVRRQKMVVRATREREVAGNRQNPCGFIAPCLVQERCAA